MLELTADLGTVSSLKKLKVPEVPEVRMKWCPPLSLKERYRTKLAGKASFLPLQMQNISHASHWWITMTPDIKRC